MINSISLAMVAGIGLRALAKVVQAYPTQWAAIRQAAMPMRVRESRRLPSSWRDAGCTVEADALACSAMQTEDAKRLCRLGGTHQVVARRGRKLVVRPLS